MRCPLVWRWNDARSRTPLDQSRHRAPAMALPDAIEACTRRGIMAVDPWRDQVAAVGLDASVRAIRDNGVRVTGYCRGGMFPAADIAGWQRALYDNRRAIDEAAALGAECLVLVVGGLPKGSRDIAAAR